MPGLVAVSGFNLTLSTVKVASQSKDHVVLVDECHDTIPPMNSRNRQMKANRSSVCPPAMINPGRNTSIRKLSDVKGPGAETKSWSRPHSSAEAKTFAKVLIECTANWILQSPGVRCSFHLLA